MAFVLNPSAQIAAVPRPVDPGDLMPFFDDSGSKYKERLETTKTALRLVAGGEAVVAASSKMVRQARLLAAQRATCTVDELPPAAFEALWSAEHEFTAVARTELGLPGGITP